MANNTDSEPLNQWGDEEIETTGTHGSDISSQRIDGLDEKSLRFALDLREEEATAVDIGSGLGAQGFRFSTLGVDTTLIDRLDIEDRVGMLDGLFEIGDIEFVQKDVRDLMPVDFPDNLKLAYSQRFIHYLRWGEAKELLELLAEQLDQDGMLFLSASGLNTELGDGYPDREKPPEDRYSSLASDMAEKHGIYPEVCLYSTADMERILTETGFRVRDISTAGFGNVKAVASLQ